MNKYSELQENLSEYKKSKWLMIIGLGLTILAITNVVCNNNRYFNIAIGIIGLFIAIASFINYIKLRKKLKINKRHRLGKSDCRSFIILVTVLLLIGLLLAILGGSALAYAFIVPGLLLLVWMVPTYIKKKNSNQSTTKYPTLKN